MTPQLRLAALLAAVSVSALVAPAAAQTLGQSYEAMTGTVGPQAQRPTHYAQGVMRTASNLGGGFIELLVTGRDPSPRNAYRYQTEPQPVARGRGHILPLYSSVPQQPQAQPLPMESRPARKEIDARFRRQEVSYSGPHAPGSIVIDTPNKFLYLVREGGVAIRYGIGVGRPGFTWAGTKAVTRKAEWPDWRPPAEMLKRRPDLPTFMAGGPENPLGARALYLGSSLYRIHGTNEPETIGESVSSGCIRMTNEDVIDLYGRVRVGTKVVVM